MHDLSDPIIIFRDGQWQELEAGVADVVMIEAEVNQLQEILRPLFRATEDAFREYGLLP